MLIDYTGLSADQATQARLRMAEVDGGLTVVKNSAFRHALEQIGASELGSLVDGTTAVVTAPDPVKAARIANELAELVETVRVRGGYVDGSVVDPEKVDWLSDLPDRETLLAQALGGMSAPLRGFANCMEGLLRKFAAAVHQLKEKRQQEEG